MRDKALQGRKGPQRGAADPAMERQVRRLLYDRTMVTPEDLRPSVETWGFHLETLRQFHENPEIAPEDTAYFAGVKAYKEAGGRYWASSTTDEAIIGRVESFRRLYEKISKKGYKLTRPIHVDIGRDGGIYVYDGHHRASIAVFLGFNISAKIRSKHRAWVARIRTTLEDEDKIAAALTSSKKRVLFVYSFCGLGGVETSVANRLKALEGTGFEGRVLFGEYYGSNGKSLADALGASVGLGRSETVRLLRTGFHAIVVIDHPDFMHVVHEAGVDCPVLFESHASFTPALPRLYKRLEHPSVSAIIVPSRFNRRLIEETVGTSKNIVVIPNAIDSTVFHPGVEGDASPQLSALPEGPVIIWIGRLEEEKNPAEFISIAERLGGSHATAQFVMVGDSYQDAEYQAYRESLFSAAPSISERLTFVRSVPYDAMPRLYNLAARTRGCLVCTSRFESVPMTFIEAMACRCPVVSTDVGGVRELITDRTTGYLYPQGEIEAACGIVSDLIADAARDRRALVLQEGAEFVATRHSPASVGAAYQQLFRSLSTDRKVATARGPGSGTADRRAVSEAEVIPGLVSTIIPVYNRSVLLREAVQSVLSQTYVNTEIIIVDDGSTDDTSAVCDRLAQEHAAVKVLHTRHQGRPGLAREAGRRVARGEFIQYLDSDDLLAPKKFETMVAALMEHPECDVAYCYTRCYRLGQPSSDNLVESTQTFDSMVPACVSRRLWLTPTPLYRRSLCDAVGPWSDLDLWEDIEYDMRVATCSTGLYHCKEMLADVRDHDMERLSKRNFVSDPRRMREMARAAGMIYESVKQCHVAPDDEHLHWFLEEVRVIHKFCSDLDLEGAVRDCARVIADATGMAEDDCMEEISIRADILPLASALRAEPGASACCPVLVKNRSTISLRGGDFAFGLSSHVLSLDGTMLQFENPNVVFAPPLRPGEERRIELWIGAPDVCGLYLAEIDMSWGPATWLKSLGNPTGIVKLLVTTFVKEERWRLQLTGDNTASLVSPTQDHDRVRLDVTRATTSIPWHIQLNQDALSVVAGRHYVVQFEARAEEARDVSVGVSMAHPPWKGLGLYRTVGFSPQGDSFALDFVAEADDDNARIHFDVGGSKTTLELSKVRLMDATREALVEPRSLSYFGRFQMDLGVRPLSEKRGMDRGMAIHEFYLRRFFEEFSADVRGGCLEVHGALEGGPHERWDDATLGLPRVEGSNPERAHAEATRLYTLLSDAFDCVLCTNVLHMIFEVEKAVREIHRILKPGGVLLVAVPHIGMYGPEHGELWRFTPEGLRVLLSRVFGRGAVEWRAYGNSLTAAGEIRGLASHEFTKHELDSHDMRFAVEVCARAVKQPYQSTS